HALGDKDGVLEVVALPRHERDQHVLAEGQLSHVAGGPVRQYVTRLDDFARSDDRLLVVAGALIRALVLGQMVNVGYDFAFRRLGANEDALGIHAFDHAAAGSHHANTRIDGDSAFHAGTDQGGLSADARHGLALHVGAHERAVGVVVLQEGNQRRRNAHHLVGRHVLQLDLLTRGHAVVAVQTGAHQVSGEAPLFVHVGGGLSDVLAFFFESAEPLDAIGNGA